MDTELENKIGIGQGYPYEPLKEKECVINAEAALSF
jgi:hypothetical protein